MSIFIRLDVVASQNGEIRRNSNKIWPYSSSRSSKAIDLGVNRKVTYNFQLVTNSNFGRICYRVRDTVYWRLKLENRWIFPSHRSLRFPLGGNPLEFGDEIWRQKTRIMGLPDGEEIMMLAFFVLTRYRRMTDGRTDRQTDTC